MAGLKRGTGRGSSSTRECNWLNWKDRGWNGLIERGKERESIDYGTLLVGCASRGLTPGWRVGELKQRFCCTDSTPDAIIAMYSYVVQNGIQAGSD